MCDLPYLFLAQLRYKGATTVPMDKARSQWPCAKRAVNSALLILRQDLHPSGPHRLHQRSVVAFGLIGVRHRKFRYGAVEAVALPQIAREHGGVARLRVGASECPAAEARVLIEPHRRQPLERH